MNSDLKLELPEKIIESSKKQPTNESLLILINYNNQLKEGLERKEECLRDLKHEKSKNECAVKSLQYLVDVKNKEIEIEKLLLQSDHSIENEWKERVEQAAKNKLPLLQEFQKKMAEYRKELFSSVGFNAELVAQEMNDIIRKQESVLSDIQSIEAILREMEKTSCTVDEGIEEENKNLTILTEELDLAKCTEEKETADFDREANRIEKEIEALSVV